MFRADLPSKRSIDDRCADGLSIRGFLGYALTETPPDHSTLTGAPLTGSTLSRSGAIHEASVKALHE